MTFGLHFLDLTWILGTFSSDGEGGQALAPTTRGSGGGLGPRRRDVGRGTRFGGRLSSVAEGKWPDLVIFGGDFPTITGHSLRDGGRARAAEDDGVQAPPLFMGVAWAGAESHRGSRRAP